MDAVAANSSSRDDEHVVAVHEHRRVRCVAVQRQCVVNQACLCPVCKVEGVVQCKGGPIDFTARVERHLQPRVTSALRGSIIS